MEKKMEDYPIKTFADILRALKEHPEWLEELRRVILTNELLEVPKKIDEILRRLEKVESDVSVLKTDVSVLKTDVNTLKTDISVLKTDVGHLKGWSYESKVKENFPAILGKIAKRLKLITKAEFTHKLEEASEIGVITEDEYEDALLIDIVGKGKLKDGEEIILAVETSVTAHKDDIIRISRRSKIVEKAYGIKTIPVVVSQEFPEDVIKIAEKSKVELVFYKF